MRKKQKQKAAPQRAAPASTTNEKPALNQTAPRFVGIRAVKEFFDCSKSTVLRKVASGEWPAPTIAEKNFVRWDFAELMAVREAQFAKRAERLSKARSEAEPQQNSARA